MKKLLFTLVLLLSSVVGNAQTFKLGDVNKDGQVTIADVMMVVDIIMNGYKPLALISDNVVVDYGSSATVNISSGYGPYTVTCSDENLVEVSLNGTLLNITGKAVGTAVVTVTDTATGYTKDINVTVNAEPLTISNNTVEVTAGESATVEITSGSGNYSVKSSDASVATATVSNGIVTITSVAGGTATITVTDTQSGQTATINVTVEDQLQSYLTCPDDQHPHLIDLGLPSGTKWACCNVDTEHPENQSPTNYGGYYAWGETEEKEFYNFDSYIHHGDVFDGCYIGSDIGSDIAGTDYDVAHIKWGRDWQMPSNELLDELENYCTYEWTTVNGVSGGKLTSKTNGGSIFLPAAGYNHNDYSGSGPDDVGSSGQYWSSTQYPLSLFGAYGFSIGSDGVRIGEGNDRTWGISVRPVIRNYMSLTLSVSSLTLNSGEGRTVSITSGSGNFTVISSDPSVATAFLSGFSVKIFALAKGTATITITDTKSGQTAIIELTVEDNQLESYLTCPDEHHPHLIDLGLPSGTKWACCNVDTDHPENLKPSNYGGLYAWGETETKCTYNWSTYIHCEGSYGTCHDLGSAIENTQYDVAHVKWGGSWQIPLKEHQEELINNCEYEWTVVYGAIGGKFTSKINGASIFLPTEGYYYDQSTVGSFWSSTQDPSDESFAYYLYFNSDGTDLEDYYRYDGQSVRPVVCNYLPLSLSPSSLIMYLGEENTVSITSGNGFYTVISSDPSVATASLSDYSVKLTAMDVGDATITVTDTKTGRTATIEVTVLTCPDGHHPHIIDLGLPSGTKWACCNVDTDHPENQSPTNYGGHYAWGETETKSTYTWSTYIHCDGDEWTDCRNIGKNIAATEYDVAYVKWGRDWVLPSKEQQDELVSNCTYVWTTKNGVEGGMFTSNFNGVCIFLPAAGWRGGTYLNNADSWGYYNSSTRHEYIETAYDLYLYSDGMGTTGNYRYTGESVRPVVRNFMPLSLSASSLTLDVGEESTASITSGNGNYTVSSSNTSVATAVVEGTSIKVTAIGGGTATITVTDTQCSHTATIEVSVNYLPLTLSASSLTLTVGEESTVSITSGNGRFTVSSSDTGVATASLSDSSVMINAVAVGSATITVTDRRSKKTATIEVTVNYLPLTISSSSLTLDVGLESTVSITSGNGNFTVRSSNTGVATAVVEGTSIKVTAIGGGTATITVTDTQSSHTAIINVSVNYLPLTISSSSLTLTVGEESTVSITSGNGNFTVSSSNTGVVTASLSGTSIKVTAMTAGTATITVTDRRSGQTATIEVTVEDNQPQSYLTCPDDHHPHLIDLGLPSGTKWACCNVDTDHPENQSPTNYGGYYAWGETVTKSTYDWNTYIHCDGSYDTCHDLYYIAGTDYDVAHVKWGGSWVMPTKEQQFELRNNCTYEGTTENGVIGGKFTSKKNGGSIFLPAAGYRDDSDLNNVGSYGYYWSSTQYPSDTSSAYYLDYLGFYGYTDRYIDRYFGFSVRPVSRN